MARALLVSGATLLGGCSFLFVDKYREPPLGVAMPDCTSSYTSPIADAAITALAAAGVIYAVATNDTSDDRPDTGRAALAGFGSVVGVVHGISAIVGTARVGTCRDEKRRMR